MRAHTILTTALVAAALVAAPASGQSLTGSWEISSETPRGAQTMTLELVHEGSDLSGTVTMRMGGRRGGGGGGGGVQTIEISDGAVNGGSFSFEMTLDFNGNSFTQSFSGTFEGGEMKGSIEGRRGSRPFTGRRGG